MRWLWDNENSGEHSWNYGDDDSDKGDENDDGNHYYHWKGNGKDESTGDTAFVPTVLSITPTSSASTERKTHKFNIS